MYHLKSENEPVKGTQLGPNKYLLIWGFFTFMEL